jgi:cadmium resistance protein CadD (predicted permease)
MNSLLAVLGASITTFAATNIDDIFLITLFFANQIPAKRIVGGQYLGFAAIIVLSLVGAWAALAIPHRWTRLLGILPLVIGIKEFISKRGSLSTEEAPRKDHTLLAIASVTLSNGSDNVGVYVPFFVAGREYLWVILTAYVVLLALWCLAGRWLGSHPLVLKPVKRWGHWAVPVVFVALGIYVLVR